MSIPYMRAVLAMMDQFRNPAEFAALITVANYARRDGVAYPSKRTIGRHIGVTPRQVWRITKALEDAGHMIIEKGAGPRGGNRYRLLFDPIATRTVDVDVHGHDGVTVVPGVHSQIAQRWTSERPTMDIVAVTVDASVSSPWTPASHDPSTDPVLRDPKKEPSPAAPANRRSKEDDDREHQTYLQLVALAKEIVWDVDCRENLFNRLRSSQPAAAESTVRSAATMAWLGRQSGHILRRENIRPIAGAGG